MRSYPDIPVLDEEPPDHLQGHVWVQEYIDGDILRFDVASEGYLRFGDEGREFGDEAPPAFRHAIQFVERTFALDDYLATVANPLRYIFFGVATHRHAIDYDWDRLPSVLGIDVWDNDDERWLLPDRVATIFDRLGPPPINTVEKEVAVDRRNLSCYEIPGSAWYDGPAAGVVFRDKHGNRAKRIRKEVQNAELTVRLDTTAPDVLVDRSVTDDRIAHQADVLRGQDDPVTFDTMFEPILDIIAREHHRELFHGVTDTGSLEVDWSQFRGSVAERLSRWLEDQE